MSLEAGTSSDHGTAATWPGPRWPWRIGLALCIIGLGVAGYLTYEHYTASRTLSCPAGGGIVNCFKVTTSHYSKIDGVPVAVLGLAYFAVMTVLQTPRAWLSTNRALRAGRVGWSIVGVATALWLVYAELFKLDAICEWCTAVHVITLLLFILTVFATAATAPEILEEQLAEPSEDHPGEPALLPDKEPPRRA
jgi:uncharacterized membrane protein